MDVYVFPSVQEGFGFGLLEAMAAGKACVASRVGGVPDFFEDGKDGFLVEPKDPKALASAIERLCKDGLLRDQFSRSASEKVRKNFGLRQMADKTYDFYTELIKKRRG
jgi:glycosyltransferase involved in cell wall biosynthesis